MTMVANTLLHCLAVLQCYLNWITQTKQYCVKQTDVLRFLASFLTNILINPWNVNNMTNGVVDNRAWRSIMHVKSIFCHLNAHIQNFHRK